MYTFLQKNTFFILLSVYVLEAFALGISPYSRDVWWAENLPIFIIVLGITFLYFKKIRFSPFGYLCLFFLPFWHTVGGHYTFERVPFEWFNSFFGFERNMFDRIGHFSVGLYAYPFMDFLIRFKKIEKPFWAAFTSVCFIAFIAMSYELIEWQYAVRAGGDAGIAFLGSQGDIWDAQKDMLMDTLGGIIATFLYLIKDKIKNI